MKFKTVFFGLLMSLSMTNPRVRRPLDCPDTVTLEQNITHYLKNYDYPAKDYESTSRCWTVTAPFKIHCTSDIEKLQGCIYNNLAIILADERSNTYCGKNNISLTICSKSNVTIEYTNSQVMWGSKFNCSLQKIDEKSDECNCQCGRKNLTKIVDGNKTGMNEYSMVAGLVDKTKKIICSCTIISKTHVITPNHCVKNEASEMGVLVGEHDEISGNETKFYPIIGCDMQPNDTYNIAICELKHPVKVSPACLPFQDRPNSFDGHNVIAVGWNETCRAKELKVFDSPTCDEQKPSDPKKHRICTIINDDNTCQMGSGGSIMWEKPNTKELVFIGLIMNYTNWSQKRIQIHSGITNHMGWIRPKMENQQLCRIY